jgi:hypothetical protein
MMFQYLSDVHLEVRPGFRLTAADVRAPFLVLAGDVGGTSTPGDTKEYVAFLQSCARLFSTTFLVAGNHEGHGHRSWDAAMAALRDVVRQAGAQGNVALLDGDTYDVPNSDVRIAGATLWSRIAAKEEARVRFCIKDFQMIGGFGIGDALALHRKDLAWLRSVVAGAEAECKRLVVVTHHAPSSEGTSHPRHEGSRMASAFATELDAMLVPPVCAWVHGHTHFSHKTLKPSGTLLLSNQRGYEEDDGAFDAHAAFDVS